jgi:peptide/nickel transport system substrate-binding protein
MKTLFFYILLLCAFCSILSSCGNTKVQDELRPAPGGINYGGTYHINMIRGNPGGLDPVLINSKLADDIALQVYDRLITFDSTLGIQPELAQSWTISPDGKEYIFNLRTDVYFHDNQCFKDGKGRRMKAADIVYSLQRACDPQARTVHYWAFKDKVQGADAYYAARLARTNAVHSISGIFAPNDSTLHIRLIRPYAPFLLLLANSLGCVVPHEAVEKYGRDFFQHPVGTGAYIFCEWKQDISMTFRRNPAYWMKDKHGNTLPYLDSLHFSFIKDDKLQLREFTNGNLDECFTLPTEYFTSIIDTANRRAVPPYTSYQLQQSPAMLTWFIDFLCSESPFDNPDIRRAFSYAVDRNKIVRYILKNAPYAAALHGITPPVFKEYSIDSIPGFSTDIQKARMLLAKAGYPNGKGFPEITFHIYPEPRLVQVAEAIRSMIMDGLGIKLNIQTVQFAEFLQLAEQGKFKMWGTRWYGDYPDPENFINLLDGALVPDKSGVPSYPNSTRYKNEKATQLFAQAMAISDIQQRFALYRQAESMAIADAPAIMLFYEMHYRLLQPYVRNYPLDAMARVNLKYVWFEKDKK